jgi:chromosomal replication initiator protein
MDNYSEDKNKQSYDDLKRLTMEQKQKDELENKEIAHRVRLVESNLPLHKIDKDTFKTFDYTMIVDGKNIVSRINNFISFKNVASKNQVKFLTLYGNTGRGKTHLAHAIGFELVKDFGVYYDECSSLLDKFRHKTFDNTYYDFMENLKEVYILILDDYGDFKDSDFVTEKLDMLINTRYEYERLTVVTTNKDLIALTKHNKRIASRLMTGECIELIGKDYRIETALKRNK